MLRRPAFKDQRLSLAQRQHAQGGLNKVCISTELTCFVWMRVAVVRKPLRV